MKFFGKIFVICLFFNGLITQKVLAKVQSLVMENTQKDSSTLFFSHNIHGELTPCGCNRFPLGGIPQIAGIFNEAKKKFTQIVYIDLGDTLFPLSKIFPENLTSKKFTAQSLAHFLKNFKIDLMVPGETDFAAGLDFFTKIANENHLPLFLSNLKNAKPPWNSEKFVQLDLNKTGRKLYFISLLSPQIVNSDIVNILEDSLVTLGQGVEWFKNRANPSSEDLLILLSHSGMDKDKEYAQKFPQIHWIIGSHSQDFLPRPMDEGKTKIVQVQAQNHYLGQLIIPPQGEASYQLIKVEKDWEKMLNPNPLVKEMIAQQKKLHKIEVQEQKSFIVKLKNHQAHGLDKETLSSPTFYQCMKCHQAQEQFWRKTPHSLAYLGLFKKDAQASRDCLQCHSLKPQELGLLPRKYHQQLEKQFYKLKGPVRDLSTSDREKLSLKWRKLDKKFKITHNYANVQCLNCHQQGQDHLLGLAKQAINKVSRKAKIKEKCLSCHTQDQTDSWYAQKGELKEQVFGQAYTSMSCPALAK